MSHIKINTRSMALGRSVSYHVYLPSDGLFGQECPVPYKTVYFLHGFGSCGDEMADYIPFRLQSEMNGIAIVVPDGENQFYANYGDLNMRFADFVGEELVRETRKLFPLSDKREDTFIGGLSMGGFGALEIAKKYEETFSKVAVMSPAIDLPFIMMEVGTMGMSQKNYDFLCNETDIQGKTLEDMVSMYSNSGESQKLFVGNGTEDPICYGSTKDFVEKLKENGREATYLEMQGGHDIFLWSNMLPQYLKFLVED